LNQNTIFPVGINSQWCNAKDMTVPDVYLKNWLLDTGSLTERLQSHCREFRVELLGQRQEAVTLEECNHLGLSNVSYCQQDWQVREVVLWGGNEPWVFARSIIPQSLCESDFANWGNKPLGQLIFNDDRFKRSPFQITCLSEPLNFLANFSLSVSNPLWGRRSVFCYQQHKMMVAEIFLPSSPAYRNMGVM
jgi:chorismate--pyruvate lyase